MKYAGLYLMVVLTLCTAAIALWVSTAKSWSFNIVFIGILGITIGLSAVYATKNRK